MTEPADPTLLELVRGQGRAEATLGAIASRLDGMATSTVRLEARVDALERRWDRAAGVVIGVGIGAGAVGGGVGALVTSLIGG